MAKRYRQRPSNIIGVVDEYTAYCFDEACVFIYDAIEDKKELKFDNGDKSEKLQEPKHYTSLSEFYNAIRGE